MTTFSEQSDLFYPDGSIALDRLLEFLNIRGQELLNVLGLQEQQVSEEDVQQKLHDLVEILDEVEAYLAPP